MMASLDVRYAVLAGNDRVPMLVRLMSSTDDESSAYAKASRLASDNPGRRFFVAELKGWVSVSPTKMRPIGLKTGVAKGEEPEQEGA
jgi:hypothetical protein